MKKDKYFYGNKLFLEITMIGYKNQGESLILCLKSVDTTPLWTAVIDCYKYNNRNLTLEKLRELGYGNNKKIDLLMITHPDQDHTKDIENIIIECTDKSTVYVMPDFINSNITETEDIKKIKRILNERYNSHESGTDNNIFYNKTVSEPNLYWKFIGSDSKKHIIKIETYLPTDSIMTMSRYCDNQHKNEYSLFVNLIIDNKMNFVFTGDCLDSSLKLLNEEDFEKMKNTLYFKIPHHGSKETTYIEKLIVDENIVITSSAACAYRSNVTNHDLLDFYCNFAEYVSVTSSANNIHDYGVLKHVYDATKGYLLVENCKTEGNACLNIKNSS